jgi:prepilin-type N-terminal cleavage/methylation domain-containing protein
VRATVAQPRDAAGFSLVELLVAVVVAGVVLTAGWAWCWSMSGSCAAACDRLDASSSVAFTRRLTSAELGECLGLVATSSCRCSTTSIAFAVPASDGAGTELVTYVYDAGRRVLWRKSASAHLAEGVDGFSITCRDAQGRALACDASGGLPVTALPLVRRVDLGVTVRCGAETATASWQVPLRGPS